ncbi:hypothetical protein FKW77_006987 [Venturia effusa]|uniref:Non-structural maintenance of chromosomes element 4 n=1 Tax=Venturia effusa TaxID=50376 RepID=A0A517LHI6_9PEZI|nr:hypothetical protein FKW77_006987 [Venturia effusa]
MARLNNPRPSTETSLWPNRATPATRSRNPSSSPATSVGSDKENRTARHPGDKTTGKRLMEPPRAVNADNSRANKRRRLTEEGPPRSRETHGHEGRVGSKWFDPDQNPEERRDVRIASRKLQRDWNDQKADLLSPAVPFSAIRSIVGAHERHFKLVKQTSDALDDSRQMIEIADLVHAKSKQLGNGVSELNINLDDFIDKWVYYGTHGRAQGTEEDDSVPTSTQRQRRRNNAHRTNADDDDDDDDEVGETSNELDWELLGEQICYPSNNRPPAPSFLLGPLAVQKKIRSTQRQGRQRREPLAAVTKPQDIRVEDLERNEASNLTSQCAAIRAQLEATSAACLAALEEDPIDIEDLDDTETNSLLRKHGLAPNWEVPLLRFAVNPNSFSQTVENLFYISFVVKDGFFLVSKDEDGLPTIRPNVGNASESDRPPGASRHQAIFSIDYETWQKLILAYNITESMIPHRDEENIGVPNAHGWYG